MNNVIAIADQLPRHRAKVLVWNGHEWVAARYMRVDDMTWFETLAVDYDGNAIIVAHATHWMAWPTEPPQ